MGNRTQGVRKGEGSLGCRVHPCRYWHRWTLHDGRVHPVPAQGVEQQCKYAISLRYNDDTYA
eukprot:3318601-Pyramimonas_sp.AAC.1